jgi:hypothetical protein
MRILLLGLCIGLGGCARVRSEPLETNLWRYRHDHSYARQIVVAARPPGGSDRPACTRALITGP